MLFVFFLNKSCILNTLRDPQSGCRRQCLGIGAKTVETLGVVMIIGLFYSFLNHQIFAPVEDSIFFFNFLFLVGLQLGTQFFLELVILRGLQLGTLFFFQTCDFEGLQLGTLFFFGTCDFEGAPVKEDTCAVSTQVHPSSCSSSPLLASSDR